MSTQGKPRPEDGDLPEFDLQLVDEACIYCGRLIEGPDWKPVTRVMASHDHTTMMVMGHGAAHISCILGE